jgi:hypothetical protein
MCAAFGIRGYLQDPAMVLIDFNARYGRSALSPLVSSLDSIS